MQGRDQRGNNAACLTLGGSQSLPLLPTSKLGPCGADSWVGGFVYALGPYESFQPILLWGWEFILLLQPPQVFTARGFEALFPCTVTLGCVVCLGPQLFLWAYPHSDMGLPGVPAAPLPLIFQLYHNCCRITSPNSGSCTWCTSRSKH